MLQFLRQKINIRYFTAFYVAGLLVYSSVVFGELDRLIAGIVIVVLYALFDLLLIYVRRKNLFMPVSSLISAFILSVIALPELPPIWFVLLPLLAVLAKHFLKFGRSRHLLNPAAFALGIAAFLIPSVSWWGVAWGRISVEAVSSVLFIVIVAAGIFITWYQRRWDIVLPFLAAYGILLSVLFLIQGIPAGRLYEVIQPLVFDSTVFFFATVMLIEPITSAFGRLRDRLWYAIFVAFFAAAISYLSTITLFSSVNIYPLVHGLLLGNLVAGIVFLERKKVIMPEMDQI